MPPKFTAHEKVYIPASLLPRAGGNAPFALLERTVRRQADQGRAIWIDDQDGETVKVSTRKVQPGNLGFCLIRIGDFATEKTLLDPLAKSVLQYLRLMLPDDIVTSVAVRTLQELEEWWSKHSAAQTHCVLIGHGDASGPSSVGCPCVACLLFFKDLMSLTRSVRDSSDEHGVDKLT